MKNFFAAAAIALFMMTSCSDDDSSSNNNNNDTVLVKKTVETYADGTSLTSNYSYDGNKVTKITVSDGTTINFTYANGKVSKIEYKDGNEILQRNEYTYDSQNRLAQMTEFIFDDGDNYADRTTFTHNSNGTVSTKLYSGDHTTQTELVEEGVVTITNGNIMKYTSDSVTYTYTFDSKNSPEKNIFAVDILNLGWIEGGVNNITSYSNNEWGGNYTKTYTYNDDNYPVTSQETTDGEVTNTTYFYE